MINSHLLFLPPLSLFPGAMPTTDFSPGTGPIYSDGFECLGSEFSLLNCSHTNSSCSSKEEAGIFCEGRHIAAALVCDGLLWFYGCLVAPCPSQDVRLAGNTGYRSGRVEVCLDGSWGSICTDGWDLDDASVVCRQLGYSPYGKVHEKMVRLLLIVVNGVITSSWPFILACFVPGTCTSHACSLWTGAVPLTNYLTNTLTPLYIFGLNCTGNEESVFDCDYRTGPNPGDLCPLTADAAVYCQGLCMRVCVYTWVCKWVKD